MFTEEHERSPLKPRVASKGLLWFPDGQLLLVAGERGTLNFVGGEREPGESLRQAFLREAGEEINLKVHHIKNLQPAPFLVRGRTTSADGTERETHWAIHLGEIVGFSRQPTIPKDSEITATATLFPEVCLRLRYPDISELALDGIRKGLDAGLIPTSPRLN